MEGWPVSVAHETVLQGDERRDLYLPLQTTTFIGGVLQIGRGPLGKAYSAHETQLLISITNLAAAFLERRYLQTSASKAEALEEADRLKSTLVSSVSHELKTPLAAVTAAVTNLLEEDVAWTATQMREELHFVNADPRTPAR